MILGVGPSLLLPHNIQASGTVHSDRANRIHFQHGCISSIFSPIGPDLGYIKDKRDELHQYCPLLI